MAAPNKFQAGNVATPVATPVATQRQSEASRREILFSFASVLVVSALIYAVTVSMMRLPV
jgi:hypothetical protein